MDATAKLVLNLKIQSLRNGGGWGVGSSKNLIFLRQLWIIWLILTYMNYTCI